MLNKLGMGLRPGKDKDAKRARLKGLSMCLTACIVLERNCHGHRFTRKLNNTSLVPNCNIVLFEYFLNNTIRRTELVAAQHDGHTAGNV